MHLVHMGLVNWHLFPLMDIPLTGPVIGISGENKSGKSTLLDALQTVMTGCDQGQMDLNRVAAEKGGRGTHRRTVQAYCLGRLSSDVDGVLRQASSSYILVVFRDPKGVKPSVTLGVALEAKVSESSVHVATRFVATGCELTASDMVVPGPDGSVVVAPWAENRARIKDLVEKAGGRLDEWRDTAKEFVREYTYVLFARRRSALAGPYIRNLINAITFKEMASADEFVRTYLLEDRPIQVSALRRSIQLYRDAAEQVKELSGNLAALNHLLGHLDELRIAREDLDREMWIVLRARISAALRAYIDTRRKHAAVSKKHRDKLREETQCEAEIGRINEELNEARMRRREALSMDRQELLRKDMALIDGEVDAIRRPLFGPEGGGRLLSRLEEVAQIPEGDAVFGTLKMLARDAAALLPGGLDRNAMSSAPERLDAIAAEVGSMAPHLRDVVAGRHADAAARLGRLQAERRDLERIVSEAQAGRISLSPQVEAMMRRLRAAGMGPRVLAELVDIVDDDWRFAAEGFLGADREAIFVSPAHCHEAIDIRSRERFDFRGARIANTRKLQTMDHRPQRGMLASVFSGSDPLAMAYVVHRTGRVGLAASKTDFDRQGRWILADGTYDDGVAIDVREPHGGLKIGSRALESAARAAGERLAALAGELKAAQSTAEAERRHLETVEALLRWLAAHAGADGPAAPFATGSAEVAALLARRREAQDEIDRLADADVGGLDADIAFLAQALKDSTEEKQALRKEVDQLHAAASIAKATLGNGPQAVGSYLHAKFVRDRCRSDMRRHLVVEPMKAYVAGLAASKSLSALEKAAQAAADDARDEIVELERDCAEEARACLSALKQSEQFGPRPDLEKDIRPWAQQLAEEIENETLVTYRRELEEARAKTNDIFRNSFVNVLIARFAGVEEELRAIRDVLRRYEFLGERYTFRSSQAPGYEAFHRIVDKQKELEREAGSMPLFRGAIDDDNPFAEDMRIVENVLLDDDIDIEAYEDYRRYFKFELEITDVASNRTVSWAARKGTASGGETQTPYYVALLSALSSVYYGGARARNGEDVDGLCLAAFDEAFSKLDEKVRLQMVAFSQELGLQLLVCGPDGGRRSMERYAHTIVDVWRSNDQSFAMADVIKERTRRELAAIDPARLSRDEVAQSLEAAQ
ncbi:SbcC/MukB-like Walker B domain-containing protein [Xanthobacter oligotrophicus]|uniref:SbcC/MukB-like Walker B domain-containing protein n=1 Tax=Xanthobacter oligotrophicus TaxID=2607286 RepID=UPI0011F38F94|nr:SbcC/MukB-like Walker B domain-containing protein [Xanthobacter oligotrophicus]MCG5237879.1 AAA family ATPase [Xanthobacter oligotrophicus]